MKNNLLTKVAVAFGAASVVVAGCGVPALADPASVTDFGTLSGFGSDTTMDVMDGVAAAVNETAGSTVIASYKAVGGKDVVTKALGSAVPRVNGSGAGRDLLRIALGQINNGTVSVAANEFGAARSASPTTAQVAGLVDFARSSSGPSGAVSNGVLTYVPFATDAMTYATSPDSKIPNNLPLGTDANNSEASIMNIYQGNLKFVIVDATTKAFVRLAATDDSGAGEEGHRINVYIPQAGSGTRSYWIGKVAITETQITNGDVPATATTTATSPTPGLSVQEHDGSAVANDPYAIEPFSISQWVAQTNGKAVNRVHGAVLNSTADTAPTTGSGTSYATNPAWTSALKRTVYNIIPTALATDAGTNATKTAFVGQLSQVCQAKSAITSFGFGLLTYVDSGADKAAADAGTLTGSGATHCGSIVSGNRVYAPSTSTVSLADPVVNGSSATVTATVASNGNRGGSVTLYTNYGLEGETEVGTANVLPGQTTVDITVTNDTASAKSLVVTAEFLPTLSGVDFSSSTTTKTINLAAQAADLTETTTSFGEVTYSDNGQSAVVRVNVDKAAAAGTVKLYDGSVDGTLVASAAIATGDSYVDITVEDATNRASHGYNLVAQFVPSETDAATYAASVSAEAAQVQIKGLPVVTSAFTYATGKASAKKSVTQNLTLTVKNGKAVDAAAANGQYVVVVYNGSAFVSEKIGKVTNGTATVALGKFSKVATYTVRVYFASSEYTTVSAKKTFKLTK